MPSAGKLPSSWARGHRIPLVADEAEGNSGWTPLTQSQPGHAPSAGHRLDGDAERAGGGGRLAIHNRGRSNRVRHLSLTTQEGPARPCGTMKLGMTKLIVLTNLISSVTAARA